MRRMKRSITLLIVVSSLAAWVLAAEAADSGPMGTSPRMSAPSVQPSKTAEDRYNEGRAQAQRKAWGKAEDAYREAIKLRAAFPEAWNGLGYALRHQKKYDESVAAYQE